MKTYVATSNPGKLAEMRELFAGSMLELHTFDGYEAVPEGEDSYRENAMIKAQALHERLQARGISASVLADDSGLEVNALDGRPGVLSARYAGEATPWPQRRSTLLDELRGVPPEKRGARFVCAMALVCEDGSQLEAFGTVDGTITEEERGASGFGFDPVFFHESSGCTFAELSDEQKNAVSHRFHAAQALLHALKAGARD